VPDVVDCAFRARQRLKEFLLVGFQRAASEVWIGDIEVAADARQSAAGEREVIGPQRAADLFALVLE
jgi:hypothetical protein